MRHTRPRVHIYYMTGKLEFQIKAAGLAEGIEISPKQDELRPHEFVNAFRALGGYRRSRKNSRSNSAQSAASTPSVTSTR